VYVERVQCDRENCQGSSHRPHDERAMSMFAGIQAIIDERIASLLSTTRRAGSSRPSAEKQTKHRDDLANAKLITSILPDYILPLASVVSRDSVPRYFKYTMVTAYLSKGIRAVRAQRGQDRNIEVQ
jgi:hypothetical protein